MPRYLGVDVGTRRVGLAISDPSGTFALPLLVIDDTDAARSAARAAAVAVEEGVAGVVVGLPLLPSGEDSASTTAARAYAHLLGAQIEVPLEFFDERLSTYEAQSSLRRAGVSARKAKGRIDAHAATVILQAYLDQNRSSIEP
ncbi:MAG: Holliday junction resolvase RuvX [Dehalococcoidia bacterium]